MGSTLVPFWCQAHFTFNLISGPFFQVHLFKAGPGGRPYSIIGLTLPDLGCFESTNIEILVIFFFPLLTVLKKLPLSKSLTQLMLDERQSCT